MSLLFISVSILQKEIHVFNEKKIRLKSKVSLALEPLDELQDITSTFFYFHLFSLSRPLLAALRIFVPSVQFMLSACIVLPHKPIPFNLENVTVPNHVGHITTRRGRLCLPYFQETISILTSIRDL